MTPSTWSAEHTARAERIWAEYQRQHNVAGRIGQIAGIDPESGRVWIGDSAVDVVRQRDTDGSDAPLYLLTVGTDYFVRKGRR